MTATITAVPASIYVDSSDLVADVNAIVLNDTAAKPASNISAYKQLHALVTDRSAWEANAYRTSNDQLYVLLQRCYALYKHMCADRATAKQLIADVDRYLSEELGVKSSTSAHTLSKVVTCVFGTDRRRVSAYSIALRAALAAKVPVADIPKYIRENRGVEAIRLAKSPNAKSPKQKAEAAAQTIEQTVLAKLTLELPPEKLDAAKVGCQHVLIVTQGADGAFDVNALVSSTSAVNAALAAHYSHISAQAAVVEVQQKHTRDDNALAQHIEAAAQSALQ